MQEESEPLVCRRCRHTWTGDQDTAKCPSCTSPAWRTRRKRKKKKKRLLIRVAAELIDDLADFILDVAPHNELWTGEEGLADRVDAFGTRFVHAEENGLLDEGKSTYR